MNRKLILIFSSIIFRICLSQNYGNVWYFGNKAGIDFNGCSPTALLNGADSSGAGEGSSTVCNNLGQLQFYTNSDKVWDKNHNVMPNGNLLSTFGSISQVIAIAKPLSPNLFYIFTAPVQGGTVNPTTLQYHIVDMSQNSGLGDVLSKNNILTTSVTVTEQLAATYHSNGTDIWIIAHEYMSNKFLAYLLTSSGIAPTPTVSVVGSAQIACPSNWNARGEIKFSPNGNKLAFNAHGNKPTPATNILEIFDFNKATGIVSNSLTLPVQLGEYGLSFSPDNSKLYSGTNRDQAFSSSDSNFVYQFDLSSGISTTIIASKTRVAFSPYSIPYGDIKIGPDNKLYIAKNNSSWLDVINNPNISGPACGYTVNGFYLGGKTSKFGLNNYIEYLNYCPLNIITELKTDLPYNIFPNPVNNFLFIETTSLDQELKITNYLGQEVLDEKLINYKNKIDISNLPSGIYFLKIDNLIKKIIKE